MNYFYLAVLVCLVVMGFGWFLMVVGHAATVRECEEHGHVWERLIRSRGDETFLMCVRCGRSH